MEGPWLLDFAPVVRLIDEIKEKAARKTLRFAYLGLKAQRLFDGDLAALPERTVHRAKPASAVAIAFGLRDGRG